jgi:hypothetical protein
MRIVGGEYSVFIPVIEYKHYLQQLRKNPT